MTQWYRIYYLADRSTSLECYTYGNAHAAAKASGLGRYRLVRATPSDL